MEANGDDAIMLQSSGYSSIQPNNIPLPLGLPILYFHSDEHEHDEHDVEHDDEHDDEHESQQHDHYSSDGNVEYRGRGRFPKFGKQKTTRFQTKRASTTEQLILKQLAKQTLTWSEEEFENSDEELSGTSHISNDKEDNIADTDNGGNESILVEDCDAEISIRSNTLSNYSTVLRNKVSGLSATFQSDIEHNTSAKHRKREERKRERAKNLTKEKRFKKLQMLFLIIQNGTVEKLQSVLEKYCSEVTIVPKFGCHQKHYDESNLVNARDIFGNCPLLLTSKMGSCRNDMTMLLLKYGANPNQEDIDRNCPLIYAALSVSLDPNEASRTLLKKLLYKGADIMEAVGTLCDMLETPHIESRPALMSLSVLIQAEYLVLTKDPIRTAHTCKKKLQKVSENLKEFSTDCNILVKETTDFALSFLDSCRTLWEARRLLCGANYIGEAIEIKDKHFLAHPFCQEIISEEFYGSKDLLKNYRKMVRFSLTLLMGTVLFPLYTFLLVKDSYKSEKWKYRYSRLYYLMKELETPLFPFLADVANYWVLLGFLISVAVTIKLEENNYCDENSDKLPQYVTIPWYEMVLWLCTLSRIMTELYQVFDHGLKTYFSYFWNLVDATICILLVLAFAVRFWSCTSQFDSVIKHGDDCQETLETFKMYTMVSVYLYSITEVVLFFRLMNFLDVVSVLGPLQLTIKKMLNDVAKLMIILIMVLLGFVCSIYSIIRGYRNLWEDEGDYEDMHTFLDVFVSLTWGIFSILSQDGLEAQHQNTEYIITFMVLFYSIIVSIVVLNMLIAMLNNTYVGIQINEDTEWKYSRAKLFMEYKKGIPAMFPFDLILTPVYIAYRMYKKCAKNKRSTPKHKVDIDYDSMWFETIQPLQRNGDGIELDAELGAGSGWGSLEDEPVLQELKMRYLLINQLANRLTAKH